MHFHLHERALRSADGMRRVRQRFRAPVSPCQRQTQRQGVRRWARETKCGKRKSRSRSRTRRSLRSRVPASLPVAESRAERGSESPEPILKFWLLTRFLCSDPLSLLRSKEIAAPVRANTTAAASPARRRTSIRRALKSARILYLAKTIWLGRGTRPIFLTGPWSIFFSEPVRRPRRRATGHSDRNGDCLPIR